MLFNNLKVAWRSFLRYKTQSFLNIAGLAAGMAVFLLIGIWVYDEWSFDTGNPGAGRIARVIQNVTYGGKRDTWMTVPYPLADELRQHYGGDFTRVVLGSGISSTMIGYQLNRININGGYYESGMPDLLDLEMIKGKRSALGDPSSILLSASTAR